MPVYLSVAEILVSVALIIVTLLQVKGEGGIGGLLGSSDNVFRTKRGIEKTLFRLTIVLAIIFIIIAVIGLNV